MEKNTNLYILYGGPSSEREVSFGTRDFFLDLYADKNPIAVEWGVDFNFYFNKSSYSENDFLKYLKEEKAVVLIASHGEFVEDGYIQEKFETFGIPFTGSDSKSCRLAMSKTETQDVVSNITQVIPTFRDYSSLAYPFIAKPYNLGSSVGIYLISDLSELKAHRSEFDASYIFQPFVKGLELSQGTVRNGKGFMVLPATEILPSADFFDYDSKYVPGKSKEITPARVSEKVTKEIQQNANNIHDLLGLGYYSRSDFILSEDNVLYYLETNALPGMTTTSLVPQQLKYANKLNEFKIGLLNNLIV